MSLNPIGNRDAAVAMLVNEVEDMFMRDTHLLTPAVQAADVNANWTLESHISGKDAVLGAQKLGLGETVFYGGIFRSLSDGSINVAIRGTESFVEWIEDAEMVLVPESLSGGKVEEGFWSVYQSLMVGDVSLADYILTKLLSQGAQVEVNGHSLGSTLATYLAAELTHRMDGLSVPEGTAEPTVTLVTFASPKVGDHTYATWVDTQLSPNSIVYNYERDIVPDVPPGDDYVTLRCAISLHADPTLSIPNNPISNHLLPTYACLLDASLAPGIQASGTYEGLAEGNFSLKNIWGSLRSGFQWLKNSLF